MEDPTSSTKTTMMVGLILGGLLLFTVAVGDAFWVPTSKRATAGLAKTAALRSVATIAFAAWLEYCTFVYLIPVKVFVVWFGLISLLAIVLLQYGWRPPFEGIPVTVRQPKKTGRFSEMDFTMDSSDLGESSAITMMFWFMTSALVTPFELMIHVLMGRDDERLSEQGDNVVTCEGMMAQELVHGRCQLLYSNQAEKTFDYPPGHRRFWKFMIVTALPALHLHHAFIAYLEAGFIAIDRTLALCPGCYDWICHNPKWTWAWHLTEECEHCWDSVQHMLDECNLVSRIIVCLIGFILMPLLFVFIPPLEALLYAKRALFKSPKTFFLSVGTWLVVCPSLCLFFQACNMFQLLFGMRPSDNVYQSTHKIFLDKIFLDEYKTLFRATHVQNPKEHLEMRESFKLSMARRNPDSRGQLRFSTAKVSSIRRLSNYRASLYENAQKDLMASGMTKEEIVVSGYSTSDKMTLGSVVMSASDLNALQQQLEDAAESKDDGESKKEN